MINNNLVLIFFSISALISLLFFFKLNSIASYLNIYDQSDDERKMHEKKIPPIGGLIFFFVFTLYILVIFFGYESSIFNHQKHILSLFATSLFIFLTGLIDDKNNLSSRRKTIIFIFLISILVLNDNELLIYFLRFLTFDKTLALGNSSIVFTILCIFIFMNAFNMYDGINLQSGLYSSTIFFFFIYKGIEPILFIPLLLTSLIFLIYNYKDKIFLGNCGSYFLSFVISAFIIKSYIKLSVISIEEILVIMIIPGLDLVRLFCTRLVNGKSPFNADRNHIHHLLSNKFGNLKTVSIIFLITFIPIICSQFLNNILILSVQLIIYLSLLKISKSNSTIKI